MTTTQVAVRLPALVFWIMLIVQFGLWYHATQVAEDTAPAVLGHEPERRLRRAPGDDVHLALQRLAGVVVGGDEVIVVSEGAVHWSRPSVFLSS